MDEVMLLLFRLKRRRLRISEPRRRTNTRLGHRRRRVRPRRRPAHPDWFRAVRDQCAHAGVPFFFKQWGDWAPTDIEQPGCTGVWPDGRSNGLKGDDGYQLMRRIGKDRAGRLLDGREHDEFPGYCRTGYADQDIPVQPFLTKRAAGIAK